MSLQNTFKQESAAFKDAQQDISKNYSARQTFLQQEHENQLVLQELDLLDEDSNIFKLIGPILVKQDPLEAKSNVKKRLDLIKGELDRLDSQLKRLDEKQGKRQNTLRQVEEQVQQITQDASQADGS